MLSKRVGKALTNKKKEIQKIIGDSGNGGKKYVKLSELNRQSRGKETLKSTQADPGPHAAAVQVENGIKNTNMDSKDQVAASEKTTSLSIDAPADLKGDWNILVELRSRGHPIKMFGETNQERHERLTFILTHEDESEDRGRNDMLAAMGKVSEKELLEYLSEQSMNPDEIKKSRQKVVEDLVNIKELTMLELQHVDESIKRVPPSGLGHESRRLLYMDYCTKYIQYLLYCWEETLLSEGNFASNNAKAVWEQTSTDLKPLLAKLNQHTINDDILPALFGIIQAIDETQFEKAHEDYLKLAIGNAPWPIGVTAVGIHARTGREKISSQQIAHVLNDETQRKYIQALKRLISFAQEHGPPSINSTK